MSHRDPTPAPLPRQPELFFGAPWRTKYLLDRPALETPQRGYLGLLFLKNHTSVGPRVWELWGFKIPARERLWPPSGIFGTKKMFFSGVSQVAGGSVWRSEGNFLRRKNIFVSYCLMSRSQKRLLSESENHFSTSNMIVIVEFGCFQVSLETVLICWRDATWLLTLTHLAHLSRDFINYVSLKSLDSITAFIGKR